jgi:hypothetical protein
LECFKRLIGGEQLKAAILKNYIAVLLSDTISN